MLAVWFIFQKASLLFLKMVTFTLHCTEYSFSIHFCPSFHSYENPGHVVLGDTTPFSLWKGPARTLSSHPTTFWRLQYKLNQSNPVSMTMTSYQLFSTTLHCGLRSRLSGHLHKTGHGAAGLMTHVSNLCSPLGRWEAESIESSEAIGLALLMYLAVNKRTCLN